MAARKKRAQPRTYHHGDLRHALLKAGHKILTEEGVHAVTLRELARGAGVSHQAPYHHFENRRHLLAAIAVESFEELQRAITAGRRGLTDPRALAQRGAAAYVKYARREPQSFRLMFGAELGERDDLPELTAAAAATFSMLLAPFGIDRAGPAGSRRDPRVLTLWSTVHGLAALLAERQVPIKEQEVDTLVNAVTEHLWKGLASSLA